jgi:hypothetical protein
LYLLSETRVAAESPAGILPRIRDAKSQTLPIREKVLPRRLSTPRLIVVGFLALMRWGPCSSNCRSPPSAHHCTSVEIALA